MKDEDKTKEQLISELVALRSRSAVLEISQTQKQQLESALESERRLLATVLDVNDGLLQNFVKSILEIPNTLVVVFDIQGRIVSFNQTCSQITGYSFDEVKGRLVWDLFLIPEEVESAKATWSAVITGEGLNQYANYWLTKQGSRKRINWSLTPIMDGKVQYIIGTGVDITERTLAEEALRESEEKFRSAFDYAAIGMALVAPDGRWLQVNRSLCDMVGYSEQELLATSFQKITHPDDLETALNYMRQMLAGEISYYQMEKRYFHKKGNLVWILLSCSLVLDSQGQPLYFIAQIKDITDRKQSEAALQRQLNRALLLKQITQEIRQSLDTKQIFETAAHQIGMALSVNRCAIRTYLNQLSPQIPLVAEYLQIGYRKKTGSLKAPVIAQRIREMKDDTGNSEAYFPSKIFH